MEVRGAGAARGGWGGGRHNLSKVGRAKIFTVLQPRNGQGARVLEAPVEAVVLRPRFPARLREATRWQLIGRFLPTSWIVILVWPLTLLLTRGLPTRDLAASLLGLATFAAVWVWFWLQPETGSDPFVSAGSRDRFGALDSDPTLCHP